MKKTTLILSALFATAFSFAQLSVRNNAYVFVNDEVVFVEDDVNLQEATTNLYLRNEAQLIQGAQTTPNSGFGALSQIEDFKEGVYGYNLWSLPVNDVSGVDNPQNRIFASTGLTSFEPVTWVPGYTPTGASGNTEISKYWLWSYHQTGSYAAWEHLFDTGTPIIDGYGFTMKGGLLNGNGSLDFRGLPNSNDVPIPVVNGYETLIGNPYPSALDAVDFIHDAHNSTMFNGDILYYYHPDGGTHLLDAYTYAYIPYTINSAGTVETYPATVTILDSDITGDSPVATASNHTTTPGRYIPISQGFFIEGTATGSMFFRNSHRNYVKRTDPASTTGYKVSNVGKNNNESLNTAENRFEYENNIQYNAEGFSIMPENKKRFRLLLTFVDNKVARELIHTFGDELTPGFDYGYEIRVPQPLLNTDGYFPQEDKFIQGIADAYDIDMKIPFVLKLAENQKISFSLFDIQNFEANQPIYLHDKQTDLYVDISSDYHIMNLEAGDYMDRFEITFKDNKQALNVAEEAAGTFNIFQNNNLGSLNLRNPNKLDVATINVYDVLGKTIFNAEDMNTQERYDISTKSLSEGVYIVKVNFTNGTSTSKKVVVKNQN